MTAAVCLYPHEVIRTRLREEGAKYRGLWRTARIIVAEEGAGALYGGLTAHLMRTVPNSAIMFFTYECLMLAHKFITSDI
jgi:solute carrier family 25 protein 33/36